MKIPASIRALYEENAPTYTELKEKVDTLIKNNMPDGWHYFSRIKEIESFALKAETGRFADISHLEDFFGCTLVVENINMLAEAEKLLTSWFTLKERRPLNTTSTHKDSASFVFDDLRLYVNWKDQEGLRPTGLNGLRFEVQVKTYLQHAWSIATHDLIYKSDQKVWARERIAFQVKAMLEHAEIVIQEADKMSKLDSLNKSNSATKRVNEVIEIIDAEWPPESLPSDKTRLASTVATLLHNAAISASRLGEILKAEKAAHAGAHPNNLSPYGTIIQALLKHETEKIKAALQQPNETHRASKILLYPEIEIPETFDASLFTTVVKI